MVTYTRDEIISATLNSIIKHNKRKGSDFQEQQLNV